VYVRRQFSVNRCLHLDLELDFSGTRYRHLEIEFHF
jgi:hypothetical protein